MASAQRGREPALSNQKELEMNHPWQTYGIADQHRADLQTTARARRLTKVLLDALRRPVMRVPAQRAAHGRRQSHGMASASQR
jgi:hypothetical protein